MRGLLVVNHYLTAEKYSGMNKMLLDAAKKLDVDLKLKTNAELLAEFAIGEKRRVEADFVLFWDKDVTLCRMIEEMGIRSFNSSKAIAACDNKGMTHAILSQKGIPMPKTIVAPLSFARIDMTDFVRSAAEKLSLPMIIKESYGSFGAQVYKADDIYDAMELASSISPKQMIFQEFVASSSGRDVRINVVGGEVVASMERISKKDFRANATLGGQMQKYEPTAEEKKIALDAAKALELDFCGVDLLFGKDEPLLCEVNSNAHVKNIYDCTGINAAEKIFEYIRDEMS